MNLPIYTYNHPVLKEKTQPISHMTDDLRTLIDNMFSTMYHARGIGLAANQVGMSLSLTVIDVGESVEDGGDAEQLVLINPVIEAVSDEEESFEEGCLSLPDYHDVVIRPSAIQVRFLDRDLREQVREVDGILARVMQHEIDHLNGIYFFERLSPIRKTLAAGKLKRIARGDIEPAYEIVRG